MKKFAFELTGIYQKRGFPKARLRSDAVAIPINVLILISFNEKQSSLTTFYRQCYCGIVCQRTDPKLVGVKRVQVLLHHARSVFEELKKD